MQLTSMTGFASVRGEAQGHEWLWEVRSVNGKTLDLRLRLPEWIDGLEPLVRKAVSAVAARGEYFRVAAGETRRSGTGGSASRNRAWRRQFRH